MINFTLSQRMQTLADKVIANKPMADIGTDHGFVPIALIAENRVPFAVLTDINRGPLEKAQLHIAENKIQEEKCSLRLGSGLEPLKPAEVSSIVIAGMGGELIVSILEKNLQKTRSYERFILQPRTRSSFLRQWLYANDFDIEEEILVREQERICEILVCSVALGDKQVQLPSSLDLPEKMRMQALFPEFLDNYICNAEKVLKSLKSSAKTAENQNKIKEWEDKLCMSISLKKQ